MQKLTSINGGTVKIRLNTDKIEDIRSALLAKYKTEVGILGGKSREKADDEKSSDMTNAEIGLVHEKGSYSRNIPRRSFLEVPMVDHAQELNVIRKTIWAEFQKSTIGLKKAYIDLGMHAQQIIQRAFDTSGDEKWPANKRPYSKLRLGKIKMSDYKKMTKEQKHERSRPLIDSGQLRASISSRVVAK
jgi:hypothetical protein